MQKQLLITYDYELFLGNRSGTIDDCMINPTNSLIKVMEPYGIKAVFFVDTTYLLRLKDEASRTPKCAEDFKRISEQLKELVRKGHFVYPHVHPHWLDASYMAPNNQWKLNDTAKYRFHNNTEADRSKVFDGSFDLLKSILRDADAKYEVDAYRAGGWCIQPFTDFLPYFIKNNVRYEFSVLGRFYQFTDAQYFDFSQAPDKTIYRFENDVTVEDPNGRFTQYNISSIRIPCSVNSLNKLWIKFLYKIKGDHTFMKGEGQPSRILEGLKPLSAAGKELTTSNWERISVELLTSVKLGVYNDFLAQNKYMHFISHPKMITRHNLLVFDKFLKKAFDKYTVESDFHKMLPE